MKLDMTNSLFANTTDVKANVPTKGSAGINQTQSVQSQAVVVTHEAKARNSVDVNMDEQNLISNLQAELKQQPDVDFDRVNQIKQQIQNGELNFNMGELAKTLANQI